MMRDAFARIGRLAVTTPWLSEAAAEEGTEEKSSQCLQVEPLLVPSLAVHKPLRILCAGPDLGSIRRELKRAAYDVTAAIAGKQAWRCLRSGFLDLMIASLGLPGLDGIRLTEHARLAGIKVPAVLFSEVGDPFTTAERQRLGITAVLRRDCPTHVLLAAVASALGATSRWTTSYDGCYLN